MSSLSAEVMARISQLHRAASADLARAEAAATAGDESASAQSIDDGLSDVAGLPDDGLSDDRLSDDGPLNTATKAAAAAGKLWIASSWPNQRQPLGRASVEADAATKKDRQPRAAESTRELPAGREMSTPFGPYWRIDAALESLWRGGERHVARGADFLRLFVQTQEKPHREFAALAKAFPNKILFLDLETCGFAGSVVFLVGVLHFEEGQLKLSQLLARNYAEEKAMLYGLWRLAGKADVLATFNGKSFDWPCVHDRSTLHHLGRDDRHAAATSKTSNADNGAQPNPEPQANQQLSEDGPLTANCPRPHLTHCDLLHHSRRKWKQSLPNCRLQTLERYICGRRRYDDISGSAIPAAYHQFVRTGDAWEMRSILHHNALDLITLLQLCLKVAE